MKSIFQNAKIIAFNVDPTIYLRQESDAIQRGNPKFQMSRSELREFLTCPRRWRAGYRDGDETTSTEWGTLMDCLILEPDKFERRFAVAPATYPDAKTGEQKKWTMAANHCKDWAASQKGKTIVKDADSGEAILAVKALRADENICELIDCSQKQCMIFGEYKDAATGIIVPVKALLDLVPNKLNPLFGKCLGDFKTSRSASPAQWPKQCFEHGYDWQAAFFMDLYLAATNEDRTDFVHIVQENFSPFEVMSPLPILSAEFLDLGRSQYVRALKKYCECLSENYWPSYPPARTHFGVFQIIEPAAWMLSQEMNSWPSLPEIKPLATQLDSVTP